MTTPPGRSGLLVFLGIFRSLLVSRRVRPAETEVPRTASQGLGLLLDAQRTLADSDRPKGRLTHSMWMAFIAWNAISLHSAAAEDSITAVRSPPYVFHFRSVLWLVSRSRSAGP